MPNPEHKAEALRLLALAHDERNPAPLQDQLRLEASIHSNLAIAEGQERVAEAVKGLGDLTAVAGLIAAVEPFTVDGGVGCGQRETDALVAAYERATEGQR